MALMKPTMTECDTNRRIDPSRRSPAPSITTPVRTESVNKARAGSAEIVDCSDVRDDHRHGPGALDGHECRAGRERTDRRADKVGIEARDRVDAGQQPDRKAVRDALHAKDDAGYGVFAQ